MIKSKLLHCPFCGEDEAYSTDNRDLSCDEYPKHFVRCAYCGARGEPTDSYDTAIKSWNKRKQ